MCIYFTLSINCLLKEQNPVFLTVQPSLKTGCDSLFCLPPLKITTICDALMMFNNVLQFLKCFVMFLSALWEKSRIQIKQTIITYYDYFLNPLKLVTI